MHILARFLSLFIKYKSNFNYIDRGILFVALTEEEIVSNSMLFFLVGYETTATTVAWMLYNLALYPDVQEKLYDEVKRTLEKHKVN